MKENSLWNIYLIRFLSYIFFPRKFALLQYYFDTFDFQSHVLQQETVFEFFCKSRTQRKLTLEPCNFEQIKYFFFAQINGFIFAPVSKT